MSGRRPHGSGTLVERAPGIWEIRVDVIDPITGKRRRPARTVHGTKKQAQAELAKMVADRSNEPAPAQLTVGELLDRVLEVRRLGDLARADRIRVIEAYIRPELGRLPLAKLTAHRIDAHYAALRERGVSESRVLKVHEILSVACRQAVAWRWTTAAATAGVARPQKAPKRDRAHTDEVIDALSVAAYSSPTWGLWFHLASTIGPRRGELAALQWADVDLDGRELHLTKAAISLTAQGVKVKSTKTGEHRRVPLDDHAVTMLREARRRQQERLLAAGRSWDDQLFVITHQRSPFGDEPVRPDAATHWFTRMRNELAKTQPAAKRVRLGDLRHLSGTWMLDAGVAPQVVAGILGNDPETLMANYAHVLGGRKRAAVDAMGKLAARRRAS